MLHEEGDKLIHHSSHKAYRVKMLGRQMYRWDENIKMDLIQIRSKDME
jgi:hypothetical protein